MAKAKKIAVGVIGYGPAFNMGRGHMTSMRDDAKFVPTAVCDLDKARLEAAKKDFPGIETYTDVDEMLRKSQVDLVTVVLPHNLHAEIVIKCLKADRHVVVEKPMAMNVAECDKMINAAKQNNKMLSVYHNRHWDSNILTIMKHLKEIGRPFRWESFQGGYNKPREWWRSSKEISGGTIFDWGAHYVEWMLQVMDYEMEEICGFQVDEVWAHATNEDEVEAVVRFKGNAVGSYTESHIAAAGKDPIRICGTEGAITAGNSQVTIHTKNKSGAKIQKTVPMAPRAHQNYYKSIADHLVRGKELVITAEWARRVIQVLDYACISAQKGKAVKAKYS